MRSNTTSFWSETQGGPASAGQPAQPSPCYETAEQNLFTRFESAAQGAFLLPYSGLLFAHLPASAPASSSEILALIYVTHTVTIKGTHLSPLLLVVQKGRAEVIRVGGSQPNGSTTTSTVRDIVVTEGHQQKDNL